MFYVIQFVLQMINNRREAELNAQAIVLTKVNGVWQHEKQKAIC